MEKVKMIVSMLIFGTLGIFITHISLPSSAVAGARAVLATVFLSIVILIGKNKINWSNVKKNALLLTISGIAIAFNWIFLFEAYRYTGVAVGTLCYYMAPVFVILLSPIILKEKLTGTKISCTAAAVLGAILISGVTTGVQQDFTGILFGLAAAALYCSVMIMNKFIKDLPALDKTFFQLAAAAVIMIPYVLLTEDIGSFVWDTKTIVLVIVVGIVHTGITYVLFFSAVGKLPAQTSAVFTYIDPATAIILAALILRQPMGIIEICGAILILGSTLLNEILESRKKTA